MQSVVSKNIFLVEELEGREKVYVAYMPTEQCIASRSRLHVKWGRDVTHVCSPRGFRNVSTSHQTTVLLLVTSSNCMSFSLLKNSTTRINDSILPWYKRSDDPCAI